MIDLLWAVHVTWVMMSYDDEAQTGVDTGRSKQH